MKHPCKSKQQTRHPHLPIYPPAHPPPPPTYLHPQPHRATCIPTPTNLTAPSLHIYSPSPHPPIYPLLTYLHPLSISPRQLPHSYTSTPPQQPPAAILLKRFSLYLIGLLFWFFLCIFWCSDFCMFCLEILMHDALCQLRYSTGLFFHAKILIDRFLTFRLTSTHFIFCVLRDLKFSLIHSFKLLNSIGSNLILRVKR